MQLYPGYFLTNRPTLIQSCEVFPGINDREVVHVISFVLVFVVDQNQAEFYYGTKLISR